MSYCFSNDKTRRCCFHRTSKTTTDTTSSSVTHSQQHYSLRFLLDAPLVRATEINIVVYNHHQHDY